MLHPAQIALETALANTHGQLLADQVSVAACVFPYSLRESSHSQFIDHEWWGFQAQVPRYPASVMKLFILAMLASYQAEGRLPIDEPEDLRAAKEMIQISSNDATIYLVGRLSGAFDGPPLAQAELEAWCSKRQQIQAWFESQNVDAYRGINILHATYEDSPYGCAYQARRNDNGNKLTALASAYLMHQIVSGQLPRSAYMMGLLEREFQRQPGPHEGDQVVGFLPEGLPANVKVWSKSGHTSWTRHDLIYAETPDQRSFILSVMAESKWASQDETFFPDFARIFYKNHLAIK